MSVSLSKGGNVSLTKLAPSLKSVTLGLGWDVRTTSGAAYDLDACALLCGANGKVLSDAHFVFYNNMKSPDGSVEHTGDNRTGEGEGDDETINVDLSLVPGDVEKVVLIVSIHDAQRLGQSFGQIRNAFIRVVDRDTQEELARYDLTEEASIDTAVIFGEIYRYNSEWKFRAVGQGYASGLAGVITDFGLTVE